MTGLSWLATRHAATIAHHLAHLLGGFDKLIFGDAAVAISIHALEAFFGISKHAATTLTFTARSAAGAHAFRRPFWTISFRCAFRPLAFTTRGTTETAAFTARRSAFRATHPLPLSALTTSTHHLGDLADLVLIHKAVAVGVHFTKALFALFFAEVGEFIFADFAVSVGVCAFDEFSETCSRITAALWATASSWGSARLTTFRRWAFGSVLSRGEAGQAQNTDAVDECFFDFHVESAFG